ncbi:D-alanine--D-alanine ligase family protein [Actinophytocola sp.]|uniref:D-alanine--D-alanine ligase family protein n=1 Tax=Actinophytocola sp. TaxID=1872138 RepID=UPI003899C814
MASQKRTRVAVVFGGQSTEHAVSCVSAASVLANLDPSRFEIVPVGITPTGSWVLGPADPATLAIEGRTLPTITSGTALTLPANPTSPNLVVLERGREGEILSAVDVVFPVLHGAFGEDGTIQGLLEMVGLPYVGAGVLASAVVMDKEFTKKLLRAEGLPVGPYEVLHRGEATLSDVRKERLGLPVFVKPARAGSSTGITKVSDWSKLDDAVALARSIDPKVLVESMIVGREIECGVLEFPDGRVEASLPAEIQILDDTLEFYDFETKYVDETAELDIPAKLNDSVTERLRAMAVEAFRAVDCQGLARVDFFVGADGTLTINELNTMPGFTPTSAYPKMWAVTGVDYRSLLSTLVDTALARGTGLR